VKTKHYCIDIRNDTVVSSVSVEPAFTMKYDVSEKDSELPFSILAKDCQGDIYESGINNLAKLHISFEPGAKHYVAGLLKKLASAIELM
jgi:hypothetical protein